MAAQDSEQFPAVTADVQQSTAVSDNSRALTMAAAINAAETNYPRIRAAIEHRNAAKAGIAVAHTSYLPQTDILWQTNRATANNLYGLLLPQAVIPSISGPLIAADNSRSTWSSAGGVLVGWEPFDFGRRSAQVSVSRRGSDVASESLTLTRLNVAAVTADAYFDLATAEQLMAIGKANVNRWQVFADAVHVLVDNQLRPGADAAQADAQLAIARTQYIQAQTSVEVRRAALSALTSIPAKDMKLNYASLLSTAPDDVGRPLTVAGSPRSTRASCSSEGTTSPTVCSHHSYAPQFRALGALSGRGAGTDLAGNFPGGTSGESRPELKAACIHSSPHNRTL